MAPTNTDKNLPSKDKPEQKKRLELAIRTPLPGNRPIVQTNKDADIDDFVGYMD